MFSFRIYLSPSPFPRYHRPKTYCHTVQRRRANGEINSVQNIEYVTCPRRDAPDQVVTLQQPVVRVPVQRVHVTGYPVVGGGAVLGRANVQHVHQRVADVSRASPVTRYGDGEQHECRDRVLHRGVGDTLRTRTRKRTPRARTSARYDGGFIYLFVNLFTLPLCPLLIGRKPKTPVVAKN